MLEARPSAVADENATPCVNSTAPARLGVAGIGSGTVPTPAVQLGPQGPYLFVIKDGSIAEVRPISVSRTQIGETVVSGGLKPGEQVVVDGQLRLVNGAAVAAKPAQNEAPKPPQPRG